MTAAKELHQGTGQGTYNDRQGTANDQATDRQATAKAVVRHQQPSNY